jgi:hypothetical protein
MFRYFFHVREGSDITRDGVGRELCDVEAARREAAKLVRRIMREKLLQGGALNHCTIEIADGAVQGRVVDTVNSRDVLFKHGRFRGYAGDTTQSAPTNPPRK